MAPVPEQFIDYYMYPTREDARVNAGEYVETFSIVVFDRDRNRGFKVYINLFKAMFDDIDIRLRLMQEVAESWVTENWRTYCERNQKDPERFRIVM